jgi:ABC-2 type transport system ATP-binding protein
VIETLDAILNRPARSIAGASIARLSGVSKNFGLVRALSSVDLNVHGGEVVAVLGPNGAGKTTAVKLLLGLASPSAGTVSVFGADPRAPLNRLRTGAMLQVGRVPESLQVQ